MKNLRIDSGAEVSAEFKDKPKLKPVFAEPLAHPIVSPKELNLWKPDEAVDKFQIIRTPLQKTYAKKKVVSS